MNMICKCLLDRRAVNYFDPNRRAEIYAGCGHMNCLFWPSVCPSIGSSVNWIGIHCMGMCIHPQGKQMSTRNVWYLHSLICVYKYGVYRYMHSQLYVPGFIRMPLVCLHAKFNYIVQFAHQYCKRCRNDNLRSHCLNR